MIISGTEYRRLNKPGPTIAQFVPDPIFSELWQLVAEFDGDSKKSQARLKKMYIF